MTTPAPAPEHLTAERIALWDATVAAYPGLRPDEIELLRLACEALDRCDQARRELEHGVTAQGRYGPRPHPALAVERDSRAAAARLLRQLGLGAPTTRHRAGDRRGALRPPMADRRERLRQVPEYGAAIAMPDDVHEDES